MCADSSGSGPPGGAHLNKGRKLGGVICPRLAPLLHLPLLPDLHQIAGGSVAWPVTKSTPTGQMAARGTTRWTALPAELLQHAFSFLEERQDRWVLSRGRMAAPKAQG